MTENEQPRQRARTERPIWREEDWFALILFVGGFAFGSLLGYCGGWKEGVIDHAEGHAAVTVLPDGRRFVTGVKEANHGN